MQINLVKWIVLVAMAGFWLASCSDPPDDKDTGGTDESDDDDNSSGDTDTDGDSDTDTDTDTDADGDTDTDADGDTVTGSGTDTTGDSDTFRNRRDGGPRDDEEGDVELGGACTAGRDDWPGVCSDVEDEEDCPGGASRRDNCVSGLICCVDEDACVNSQNGVCVAAEEECAEGTENRDRGCPAATPVCCY